MKKDVLFIRSFTPDFDGKFNKYAQALDEQQIPWFFLGWDRTGKNFQSKFHDQAHFFRKKALLGGSWKNIINLLFWNVYVAFFLCKYRKDIKILHVIDFDSAAFAYPIARLLKKKVIFDVYDKYTSMRRFPSLIQKMVDGYEKFILKHADLSILADESRYQQHKISKYDNIIVLENVPKAQKIKETNLGQKIKETNLSIGYFGVLEKNNRGLEDIVNAVLNLDNCEFHVAGYGELEVFFQEVSSKYPEKIKFYGAQDSSSGLSIMQNVDILLGLYYRNVPNHLYAAPNKYFEHLMLGKPLITTKGTPPGYKVIEKQTGWAIIEGAKSLEIQLREISVATLEVLEKNSILLWNSTYQGYFEDQYVGQYGEIVKRLSVV